MSGNWRHETAPLADEKQREAHHGWEIEFGANIFLVELAIRRCVAQIENAASQASETGAPVNEAQLRKALALAVRSSVANYNGHEYLGYYDASDGFMRFGTQAIHVASFVSTVCEIAEVYRVVE
jgi:hypothetical protein